MAGVKNPEIHEIKFENGVFLSTVETKH